MASLNKDSSQKNTLDDGINILAVNVEQNDVRPWVCLANQRHHDLTQTSTKIPQMINIPRSITKMNGLHSYFLLIRKVSEKGQENMRSIPRVTRKGSVTSNTIFGFFACEIYQRQRAMLCAR